MDRPKYALLEVGLDAVEIFAGKKGNCRFDYGNENDGVA
jgi:hypothetical protein